MPESAHVTSIAAIEAFRARLLVYASKARPVLDEASDEVTRLRQWLQTDRRVHWEQEVRRRGRELEQAQQALFSAGMANLREPTAAEKGAVERARRRLAEAEAKLRRVKRWLMEFDNRVEPLVKQLDPLRSVLTQDVPKAAAYLAQTVKVLDAYAGGAAGPVGGRVGSGAAEPGAEPAIEPAAEPEGAEPQRKPEEGA